VLLEGARQAFTGIFASALQVAAPVLLALVLTDAAFGLVSRVVPQLNVFAVGAPAKVLVGLLLIGASLPFVTGLVADQFQGTVTDALNSIGVAP
jgi:flagellar biosynthetic protein FliR